jgi:hypothetical protein
MVDRVAVPDDWKGTGMTIDATALANIVIAQKNNMFCGVMNIPSKKIYLAALHGYAPGELDRAGKPLNTYGTVNPRFPELFPQRIPSPGTSPLPGHLFRSMINGRTIAPIRHKDPTNPKEVTSHDQLVVEIGGRGEEFCGFALRFESSGSVGEPKIDVKLSPTSRTLNPQPNGQLEKCIFDAIFDYLKPKLALLGMTLTQVDAGTNPDKSGMARLVKAGLVDAGSGAQVTGVMQQQALKGQIGIQLGGKKPLRSAGAPTCPHCQAVMTSQFLLNEHIATCPKK